MKACSTQSAKVVSCLCFPRNFLIFLFLETMKRNHVTQVFSFYSLLLVLFHLFAVNHHSISLNIILLFIRLLDLPITASQSHTHITILIGYGAKAPKTENQIKFSKTESM